MMFDVSPDGRRRHSQALWFLRAWIATFVIAVLLTPMTVGGVLTILIVTALWTVVFDLAEPTLIEVGVL